MMNPEEPQATTVESARTAGDFATLLRAVHRLTIAVWCLIGLLVAMYASPWLTFLWRAKSFTTTERPGPRAMEQAEQEPAAVELPYAGFDNHFHERAPEEKIQRATVILLTAPRREGGKHTAVITEIIKRSPGVRLYYEVGDEYASMRHSSSSSCEGCDGEGAVVFMVGNPAQMASSYSYRGERIDSLGGLSIEQLRAMAGQPGVAAGAR